MRIRSTFGGFGSSELIPCLQSHGLPFGFRMVPRSCFGYYRVAIASRGIVRNEPTPAFSTTTRMILRLPTWRRTTADYLSHRLFSPGLGNGQYFPIIANNAQSHSRYCQQLSASGQTHFASFLSRLSVSNLQVGESRIDLELERQGQHTACRVFKQQGHIKISIEP